VAKVDFDYWPRAGTTWPNIYGFCLSLIATLLILSRKSENEFINLLKYFLAGIFILSTLFIRINFIFVYAGFTIFIMWNSKSAKKILAYLAPSIVLAVFALPLVLYKSEFASRWFQQTFLNPLSGGHSAGVPTFDIPGLIRSSLLILFVAIFFLLINMFLSQKTYKTIKKDCFINYANDRNKAIFASIFMFMVTIIILSQGNQIIWLKSIFGNLSFGFISISLFVLFISLFRYIDVTHSEKIKLVRILAICSLPLCHNLNLDYIWLNSIYILMFGAIYISQKNERLVRALLQQSIAISLIILIIGNISILKSPAYSFQAPILGSMKDKNIVKGYELDREMNLLSNVPSGSFLQNRCVDSLYAVANPSLVQSGNSLSANTSTSKVKDVAGLNSIWVFDCDVSPEEFQLMSDYLSIDFVVMEDQSYSVIFKEDIN
jgi:hypothetical protein